MKIDLLKIGKALQYLGAAERAVEVATDLNADKVYKHKDKVDKTLQGASKALSAVRVVVGLAKGVK